MFQRTSTFQKEKKNLVFSLRRSKRSGLHVSHSAIVLIAIVTVVVVIVVDSSPPPPPPPVPGSTADLQIKVEHEAGL